MYSLDYILAHTRLVRRALKWNNIRKINGYRNMEARRYDANPIDLRNFEKKITSQNGEDGIIEEIFNRIGTTNKFFVEFGIEDGTECNTRHLMEHKGWKGLWMDGSESNCQKARTLTAPCDSQVFPTFITAENIENLFQKFYVPKDLDLLSIDIDGNDFWIWKTLSEYEPRVLIIEYNASYPPPEHWIMPYKIDHMFDGTNYFGASLSALIELGKEKGYTLIACDKMGVNAFFLRDDLVSKKFLVKDAEYFYSCPKYNGYFFGHPAGKGPWIQKR